MFVASFTTRRCKNAATHIRSTVFLSTTTLRPSSFRKSNKVREDVGEVHSQVRQDTLRRVDKTFDAFFRRCQNGETPGYPRFKSASRYDSFTYPQSGFRLEGDKLHLSKIGSCRVRLSRSIEGTVKTCTIKREVDGWYAVFVVEENQCRLFPKTGDTVGVDLGIENFATLSTGEVVENPEFLRESDAELKTTQRRVSRRRKGSKRRRKAVNLLRKKHQKIRQTSVICSNRYWRRPTTKRSTNTSGRHRPG